MSDNSAGGFLGGGGGGIWNEAMCTIAGCTIAGNEKGGIVNVYAGTLTMSNCTVSGNHTSGLETGGGVNSQTVATLTNCTITENSTIYSNESGGVTANGSFTLTNCIVANNSGPSANDLYGDIISGGHNLIGDETGGTITAGTGDQIGSSGSPIDPMLGPLQDNGGPTETHALLPGSPAIEAGGEVDGISTDQRGLYRAVDDPAIAGATEGNESDIGAFELQAAQALNISTRLQVTTGDNVLIAGFIVAGTERKRLLIRGTGPSLADAGIADPLPNPFIELHEAADIIGANDDWKDAQETEIEETGAAPTDDREAALIMSVEPGAYTAILKDFSGDSGVGLIEVYDLDTMAISNLANISTRGFVDTGDNVMIAGFIIGAGEGPPNDVLIRAIGPSLGDMGVANPLPDPELELRGENGELLAANDNWKETQQAEIESTGVPPTDNRESAIVKTLTSGAYTAVVLDIDGGTGVALVEAYDLH